MNISPSQWILRKYQDMCFSRNLIFLAWNECQGYEHLLLNTLLRLPPRQPYIQQKGQNLCKKRIPKSTFTRKMSRMKHINLRFEGDNALEELKLRKLGLFSKKAFKDAKSLSLEYRGKQTLRNEHMKVLADHLNRGLRRLKHLSIKLEMEKGRRLVNMIPLLKSIKQSFVSLVCSFERLFAKISPTLKHLDLDLSRNPQYSRCLFESFGISIMKHLQRLESLCLNFDRIKISTKIVRLLMSGACTHLKRLKSLDINVEDCIIVPEDWESYPVHNLKSDLQDLKLKLNGSKGLSLKFLSMLQSDILTFYPKLQRLFIGTRNDVRYSNGFYIDIEEKFLQNLNLKWFRLEYSLDIENRWDQYQEMELLEMKETMLMENKVAKVKQGARGEEEVSLYLKALRDEEQSSEDSDPQESDPYDDGEYYLEKKYGEFGRLEEDIQKEEDFENRIEEEIRFRDLTQGGQVSQIHLDYGDSYEKF